MPDQPKSLPNETAIEYDQQPLGLQELIKMAIFRLGKETNNKNRHTGEFSNLRALAERSGVSRTAIGHVVDGRTKFMSERNIQKICRVLEEFDPPIINPHTGEPIPTDWLTIVALNMQAIALKTQTSTLPNEDQPEFATSVGKGTEPSTQELLSIIKGQQEIMLELMRELKNRKG